jgi:hypothetical protein
MPLVNGFLCTRTSCVTPDGVLDSRLNIPTASAMGYVVPSLRDFRRNRTGFPETQK